MADENNPFDDEFHFSDGDDEGIFDEDSSAAILREDTSQSNMKRNLMIGIGGLLLVLALYKFVGGYLSKKPAKKTSDLPVVSQVAKTTQPAPVTPVSTPVIPAYTPPVARYTPPPAQSTTNAGISQKLVNKLDLLERGLNSNQSDISNINNNVDSVKNNLSNLSSAINQLNNSISMLTHEVQQQQDQIAQLKRKQKAKPRRVYRKARVKKTSYFIQAIIPGRAWLKTKKGATITVSEGSLVSGYGRVKIIDPHQQEVVMSSGEVIRFSPSDS